MTPIQHLERLYTVIRKVSLSADDHDALKQSAEDLAKFIRDAEAAKIIASDKTKFD